LEIECKIGTLVTYVIGFVDSLYPGCPSVLMGKKRSGEREEKTGERERGDWRERR
jgi:hypothetical protein